MGPVSRLNVWLTFHSALFTAYLGYSIWNCIPTEEEKVEREADRRSDLEMKKLSTYGMDGDLSKDERRERNRELFLSLPKTPNTPGFGAHNPMTPRTVAFTALNGGVPGTATGAGPSRNLPFRDYHGSQPAFDGR